MHIGEPGSKMRTILRGVQRAYFREVVGERERGIEAGREGGGAFARESAFDAARPPPRPETGDQLNLDIHRSSPTGGKGVDATFMLYFIT
jgi:hypothetical protein